MIKLILKKLNVKEIQNTRLAFYPDIKLCCQAVRTFSKCSFLIFVFISSRASNKQFIDWHWSMDHTLSSTASKDLLKINGKDFSHKDTLMGRH